MILVPCPHCGPRNSSEFRHVGESAARPDPASATPRQWREYLYVRSNPAGWTVETWYHRAGCRAYFEAERHTVTNRFRRTWLPGQTASTGSAVPDTGSDSSGLPTSARAPSDEPPSDGAESSRQ